MVKDAFDSSTHKLSNDYMHTYEYELYIAQFGYLERTDEFHSLYSELRRLRDASDVDCLYLLYVDKESKTAVYLVDSGDTNICHPGSFDYLKGDDLKVLEDPQTSIVYSTTSPEVYGEIVGSVEPIVNKNGDVVAYIGVDISMAAVNRQRIRLLINTVLTVLAFALIITAVGIYASKQLLMKPLERQQVLAEESEILKRENLSLAKRARAADKISELTSSLESLLTNMPAMTFSKDVENGRYLACNQMFAEYAQKSTPSEVIGLTDEEIFDEATAAHFIEDDNKALAMNEPYIFREEVPDAHGNMKYLQTTKLKFKDANGRLCLLGMSMDVSELVLAKKENVKTRDAYKQAMSERLTYSRIARALSSDYSFLYYVDLKEDRFKEYSNKDGFLEVEVEREGEDFFNQSVRNAREILHPEDQDRFIEAFSKEKVLNAIAEKGKFEIVYRLMTDGVPAYMNLKAVPLEEEADNIIIGISNIDAEMKARQAAERLKEEQATYQRIAALSGKFICIYTIDPKTDDFVEFSTTTVYHDISLPKEGADFFEKTRQETERIIFEEDKVNVISALTKENIMSEIEKTGLFSMRYRLYLDGEPKYVRMQAAVIEEKDGPQLIVGVTDIDARMKLEHEYAENLAEAQTKANFDVLTGVMNKHAYVEYEKKVNERVKGGREQRFAVVVCDLNGFKHVNDTLGHKAGDELIIRASRIISDIFIGGKVFRVGGDEFAVIFEGEDVKHLDDMMKTMQDGNERNRLIGEIVIACGMAISENGADMVETVFERADESMYVNKQYLKRKG